MDPPHFDDEATAPLPEGKSDASQQEETKCGGEDSDEDGRLCWAAALRAAVEAAERDPILVPRPRRPSRVAATYAERPMVRAEAKRAGRRMRGVWPPNVDTTNARLGRCTLAEPGVSAHGGGEDQHPRVPAGVLPGQAAQ
mmetsp:Transcript_14950/g.56767  ORF Transcript_14950/g.56767 Transcript_14950/m.56767 type:complete len:140 (-) Transcript_14950:642-1061(-)